MGLVAPIERTVDLFAYNSERASRSEVLQFEESSQQALEREPTGMKIRLRDHPLKLVKKTLSIFLLLLRFALLGGVTFSLTLFPFFTVSRRCFGPLTSVINLLLPKRFYCRTGTSVCRQGSFAHAGNEIGNNDIPVLAAILQVGKHFLNDVALWRGLPLP